MRRNQLRESFFSLNRRVKYDLVLQANDELRRPPIQLEKEIVPHLRANLPPEVEIYTDIDKAIVYVYYTALSVTAPTRASGLLPYIETRVKIELGGASSGKPNHQAEIVSDVSMVAGLGEITLPTATVVVMNIQRTFWEKVTLAHVACIKGDTRIGDVMLDIGMIWRRFMIQVTGKPAGTILKRRI